MKTNTMITLSTVNAAGNENKDIPGDAFTRIPCMYRKNPNWTEEDEAGITKAQQPKAAQDS